MALRVNPCSSQPSQHSIKERFFFPTNIFLFLENVPNDFNENSLTLIATCSEEINNTNKTSVVVCRRTMAVGGEA